MASLVTLAQAATDMPVPIAYASSAPVFAQTAQGLSPGPPRRPLARPWPAPYGERMADERRTAEDLMSWPAPLPEELSEPAEEHLAYLLRISEVLRRARRPSADDAARREEDAG